MYKKNALFGGRDCNTFFQPQNMRGGPGGPKVPSGFSIGCHFSQDHAMVTKILEFINKHPK